ncbi:MAG: efflux RND transporter periplasmic adaptor subunit [Planctomycetes bacterium]|nr:efflux RND transporter periplasmic adaptor subunit [Planctomycetota bacterium]
MSATVATRILTPVLVLAALVGGLAVGARWHERVSTWFGHDHGTPAPKAPSDGAPAQLWTCGMHPQVLQDKPGTCPICQMKLVPVDTASKQDPAAGPAGGAKGERKIAYWWDPMMKPPYISDRPGKSPMGMDLIPVYEDEVQKGTTVAIDPVVVQNMGIRVADVREGPLRLPLRTVGILREAEPNQRDVTLKIPAWIERLHADTEGMLLRAGDPLFEVYSPDLLVAAEELLAARSARDRIASGTDSEVTRTADDMLESARKKLLLWDVAPSDIEAIEQEGKSRRTILFRSPLDGFLTEKMIVQGTAVEPGMKLLRIVDQSRLWLDAQVYEEQLPYLALGQKLVATVKGLPGRTFEGEVSRILPLAEPTARTVAIRIELPNPELLLKPGMYAIVSAEITLAERAMLVPREAVIDTGTRTIAFLARDGGRFEPRIVKLGVEALDGEVQVLEGLAPGDRVVTSGQFLLDVESRLREAIQKMLDERLAAAPRAPEGVGAGGGVDAALQGKIDSVVTAYLAVAQALAADEADRVPALAEALRKAAEPPADVPGHATHLLGAVRDAADLGPKLDEQRERFRKLSEAVIALADAFPPSSGVAPRLYVVHCPMVGADWIQTSDDVKNPYYGAAMMSCGEVARKIEAAAGHEHGGSKR